MSFIDEAFWWALKQNKSRKLVFYFPLAAWVTIVFLASAYGQARSEMVQTWLEGILIPVVDLAPFFVGLGEDLFRLLLGGFLIHTVITFFFREHLTTPQQKKNIRILVAELFAILGVAGLISAFALPAQPDLVICIQNDICANPGESFFRSLCMLGYPIFSLGLLIGSVIKKEPRQKKSTGRKAKS
jgi:hypothetical protein